MLVRYTQTLALWLVAALWLAACATPHGPLVDAPAPGAQAKFEISGSVLYRERILLPPGSVVTVSLEDLGRAGALPERLAVQRLVTRGEQVPIPFVLAVPQGVFEPTGRYTLRATIHDTGGTLRWATDTLNLIDPRRTGANMDRVLLIMTAMGF
ncbi:YbaY family lipoprotein [Marinobacter sp. X15-166B]|uniref:YbaY family lipoprotein n=1 Tax=Marinobacter sp. X15-166B TaxID=1897620 RepID=UPI00085C16FA|nr:YbaY family lipoprotein [Marinobacter sp. X15-166B]OEY65729.1 hypothetical protein BG841_04180 [Marinobacter sp. X15-166B]